MMARWTETYSVFTNAAGDSARRVFMSIGRKPSFFERFLFFLLAAVAFSISLLILIPLIALGIVLLGSVWLYAALRRALGRAAEPDGVLDPRKNVRVVRRD